MGKRALSSKLLKGFSVVVKSDRKVVALPETKAVYEEKNGEFEHITEEQIPGGMFEDLYRELEERRKQAQKELDEWRQEEEQRFFASLEEAKQKGYEEGYHEGIQNGLQEAEQQYKEQLQQASDVLQQAYEEKLHLIQEAEPFVIELSMEIAKKILQQELKEHPDSLLHIVRQSLATVYESSSISIGVAPSDFAFVQKQREQLLAVVDGQVEIKIFPDYSVQQGGCLIRTSYGSIDARIDVQLSEIKKALLSLCQEEAHD